MNKSSRSQKGNAANEIPAKQRRGFIDIVNNNALTTAIRRGLALAIPLMIFGAFAIFINNLPVPAYQDFMLSFFGESWRSFGEYVWQATFGILSIYINLLTAYSITESKNSSTRNTHPMIGALVSLSCLFAMISVENGFINQSWIGTLGVFIAILTAFAASMLYNLFGRIRFLRFKLFSNAAEINFTTAIDSLIPAVLTISIFVAARILLVRYGITDIHTAVYDALRDLFTNFSSELLTALAFSALTHILWFFGIHGNNVLEPVAHSIMNPALEKNMSLTAQGLPPSEIFTKQFFDAFVFMGGSGVTICLIIAILIGMKRSNTRKVAGISILPALINVNEIMIFGIPVVLNPYLLIPFVLAPITLTYISYAAMNYGLVPLTVAAVEWTTPIFISGYIATGGSIYGTLLQCVNIIAATLIYLPFMRMYERSFDRDAKRSLSKLMTETMEKQETRQPLFLERNDAEGSLARSLALDLIHDLHADKLEMHYQPLVNADNSIFGVEALLRWKHKSLGNIPPPVVIAIAEDAGLINELGEWIVKTSMQAMYDFSRNGINDIVMSINITPSQLDQNSLFREFIHSAKLFGIDRSRIDIEITEQSALGGIARIRQLANMKKAGFRIAMDDFGMGHGSLSYLKDFDLDVIKIDGSLIKEIGTNQACNDIIATIINLCQSMNIHVIAEFVETERQKELLEELGCTCYQGYLYSPALPFEESLQYLLSHNAVQNNTHENP